MGNEKNEKNGGATVEPAHTPQPTQSQLIAQAVKEAMLEAIPQAIAIQARISNPEPSEAQKLAAGEAMQRKLDAAETCGDCGQRVSGCRRKHRMLVVFPKDENFGPFFQGVKINGVMYISNGPQHQICVPADTNFEYIIEQAEKSERNLQSGRSRHHNSGSIGGGSDGFRPAIGSWS